MGFTNEAKSFGSSPTEAVSGSSIQLIFHSGSLQVPSNQFKIYQRRQAKRKMAAFCKNKQSSERGKYHI